MSDTEIILPQSLINEKAVVGAQKETEAEASDETPPPAATPSPDETPSSTPSDSSPEEAAGPEATPSSEEEKSPPEATTEQAEASSEPREKTVDKTQQMAEIIDISTSALGRRDQQTRDKQKRGEQLDANEASLIERRKLETTTNAGVDGIDFSQGTPAMVTLREGEKPVAIHWVNSIQGDKFYCSVNNGSAIYGATVTREQVVNAYTVAEAGKIKQLLTPEEQAVFDLHVGILSDENKALEGKSPEEVNTIITEAADAAGMFSTDTIAGWAKAQVDSGEMTKEQAQAIEAAMQGKNVLDEEGAMSMLTALGATDNLRGMVENAKRQLAVAAANFRAAPDNPVLKQQLDEATEALQAAQKMNPEQVVSAAMKRLYSGEISAEDARALRDAFIQGDVNTLTEMFAEKPGDSEKDKQEKSLRRRMLEGAGKGSGGLLYVLFLAMKETYQEVKKM